MTLNEVIEIICGYGLRAKRELLTCGATHVAIDDNGSIFAYKGEPRNDDPDGQEWLPGRGEEDRTVMYCGVTEYPGNWKSCVWKLP